MGGLAELLRGHLVRPEALDELGAETVEPELASIVNAATAAWPDVSLPVDTFIGRVGFHFSDDETLLEWLRRVRASDLYLATACANQVPKAIDTFDRQFLSSVPAILARGGMRSLSADEIRQRVRERLFVGAPRIGDYSGRGPLSSWVQVITLRIAIDTGREERALPIADSIEVADLNLAGTDPELRLIKEHYREPFKQALRAALRDLKSEQRTLLKLHFVDGVTLDRLGELFHVHRSTIVRRIAQARETTFQHVRTRLQAELGIDDAEFEGLLALLRSRLELSMSALLPTLVS